MIGNGLTAAMIAETFWDLSVASLRLRFLPFEGLVAPLGERTGKTIDREEARRIGRALRGWDRRLPWRTMCFEQGLAAMRYLRRHGHAATLHYGARGAGEDLEAHVWVTSGDVPVVGCDIAADFRELRRFPAE